MIIASIKKIMGRSIILAFLIIFNLGISFADSLNVLNLQTENIIQCKKDNNQSELIKELIDKIEYKKLLHIS